MKPTGARVLLFCKSHFLNLPMLRFSSMLILSFAVAFKLQLLLLERICQSQRLLLLADKVMERAHSLKHFLA